ncbi:related to GIY-YIG endonuclease (mitochondrion) [Serendipita indica DSM 11827]|jgi:hypothetical protein|uniref:Related to GIY-YIG endonuclease n=1 Tax=Serendipita indica (strain DSM 11827) TaxID=1109443 RepID=G4U3E6_SERID|nr:related to GIY-YIG endonuclease [Serendipita indica DSM 11827]
MDLLNPAYNILKKAGSALGRRHSEESIEKMKKSKKTTFNTTKGTAAVSKSVKLIDTLTSTTTIFPSISAAEKSINASQGSLHKALKSNNLGRLYKRRYQIILLPSFST